VASLYDRGWRQGSLLTAALPIDTIVLGATGEPERDQQTHERWVVVTQDCDLDRCEDDEQLSTIELRPALNEQPPSERGIRAAKFLLSGTEYLHSTSPRAMVSAAVLMRCDRDEPQLTPDERRALKTWLGLRYDRAAVPREFEELAKAVATEVERKRHREIGKKVRDVLMQFDGPPTAPRFFLTAVLENAADQDEVRTWLSSIAQDIPIDRGVAAGLDAAPASMISLELIETSYAANLSHLTWRPGSSTPEGAEPT
jgi:hypothetical protein